MWFKNLQIYQFSNEFTFDIENFTTQLEQHRFHPCVSILPMSLGWQAPINEVTDAPLIHAANGIWLLCLKIEEKLLPSTVVRNHAIEVINKLETEQERKLNSKEKASIREESYAYLLPKAFSKYKEIYAIIDPQEKLLLIDTGPRNQAENFITFLRKTIGSLPVTLPETIGISQCMTRWLKTQRLPQYFQYGETCVLQDNRDEMATIRCTKQDLHSSNIQAFLKDGMEVKQIQLHWKEQLTFILHADFSITQLKFSDAVNELANDIHTETSAQRQDAEFFIMTQTVKEFLQTLMPLCIKKV